MKDAYGELRSVFDVDQSCCLLLMILLCGQFAEKLGRWDQIHEAICRGGVNLFLREIEEYEIKEAALMLDRLIDWDWIENREVAGETIDRVTAALYSRELWMDEAVFVGAESILEATEGEGSFSATPTPVRTLIVELSRQEPAHRVAEFCCGSSIMGILASRAQQARHRGPISFYGEDRNALCCVFSRVLAWLGGVSDCWVSTRDTLQYAPDEVGERYDLILSDLPVGSNVVQETGVRDRRMGDFSGKGVYADWVFLQDCLYRLDDRGRAFVLVTKGALVRKNEAGLREAVLRKGWLEAVIALPAGLDPVWSQERELLVFRKGVQPVEKVLFCDLAGGEHTGRSRWQIAEERMSWLVRTLQTGESDGKDGRAVFVDREMIQAQNYSWNPYVYLVSRKTEEKLGPWLLLEEVATVTRGLQLSKEEEERLKEQGTHYLLNTRNIEDGNIVYEPCVKIARKTAAWKHRYQIQEDDIVLISKGAVFRMAVVPPDPPDALINGTLTIIRTDKERYHPYVLYAFLKSEDGKRSLEGLQTGSTVRLLNSSNLSQLKIPRYEPQQIQEAGERLKENELRYRRERRRLEEEYRDIKTQVMNRLEIKR